MTTPALIAVDWGTTSCRAALLSRSGGVIETRENGPGILAVKDGTFESALLALIAPWRALGVPVILSGMIGSKQGWREAPYARCPAGLDDIVSRLAWIDTQQLGRIALIPGLDTRNGDMPDVMRGEETQIIGAMGDASGIAVLPGTHSKWARVDSGRIVAFRSYMTGEVFATLKDHTILGRLMQPSAALDDAAFARGLRNGAAAGGPGALLNRVFAARTLGLFDHVPPTGLADYLSGLLIGAEIADNTATTDTSVMIIGSAALTARYAAACRILGRAITSAPPDSAARGAFNIARAADLIS